MSDWADIPGQRKEPPALDTSTPIREPGGAPAAAAGPETGWETIPQDTPERGSSLGAFAQHYGQGGTLGWGDELGARLQQGLAYLKADPNMLPADVYRQALGENRANLATSMQEHPLSSLLGEVGGAVAGTLAPGAALGRAGLALNVPGRLAQSTLTGAAQGAGSSDDGRLGGALAGGGAGLAFGGAGEGLRALAAPTASWAARQALNLKGDLSAKATKLAERVVRPWGGGAKRLEGLRSAAGEEVSQAVAAAPQEGLPFKVAASKIQQAVNPGGLADTPEARAAAKHTIMRMIDTITEEGPEALTPGVLHQLKQDAASRGYDAVSGAVKNTARGSAYRKATQGMREALTHREGGIGGPIDLALERAAPFEELAGKVAEAEARPSGATALGVLLGHRLPTYPMGAISNLAAGVREAAPAAGRLAGQAVSGILGQIGLTAGGGESVPAQDRAEAENEARRVTQDNQGR